ncbi:MAG: ROK family protein [Bacteroidales bacterium]|nr:ROK family protein [Bacteroidales bacterium]MDZ4203820.1 ROK family protein [Bacteroidales bacterium]
MKDLVIGIDIGGTFTKFGFVDREGNFYAKGTAPTDIFDNVDDYLINLVKELQQAEQGIGVPYRIIGVGIGAPNANYHKGTIENAPNLKWKGIIYFGELFRKYYDAPVKLTNDANAAALGEMIYGGARGMKDFIMITLGTGLGSGIVVNGDLVYGHDGFAGELGHVNVLKNGRRCGCGNYGCLETYVSAPGIKRTVFELLASDHEGSALADYSFNELNSEMIYEAAIQNDPVALKAFDLTGKILGTKLADSVAHTSPEAIFLFGGLAKSGRYIFEPTKKYMEESMMGLFKNKVAILPSGLMDKNAAVLGAGALIWKDQE